MNRGCWKVDENDEGCSTSYFYKTDKHHNISPKLFTELYKTKQTGASQAIYIDIEDDDDVDDGSKEYSKWSELPDLLLEKIFFYLSIKEKYYASLVCKSWHRAFYLPYIWSQFTIGDSTLTRGKFNYYCGWQYVLDHLRAELCLANIGRYFRNLTFEPMMSFNNLYEFMNMLSFCVEKRNFQVCHNLRTLKFTFSCNMNGRDDSGTRIFGTGGKLLEALKRLMGNLTQLRRLELYDLMLESQEAQFLLDEVAENCHSTLKHLSLINATKFQYQIFHIGIFLNLQILIVSPQNLGDEVVELLGYTKLRHLHILQNKYTPKDVHIKLISPKAWKSCRQNNPALWVHLQLESNKEKALIWQEGAPVRSILYNSPHNALKTDTILTSIEFYRKTLKTFGHLNIPRFHRSASFHDRIDGNLMLLVRNCQFLTTLIVTERMSTATTLLIACTAKNLKKFHVRGNAVIIRCDWPQNPEWSDDFYYHLKINSRSYEMVEKEISKIMGYTWKFLTDKQFKNLHCDLHV